MQNIMAGLQRVIERNLDDRGSILENDMELLYTPQRSDWLWRPLNLICYEYRGLIPGG
jgi:hypothetical protein